MHFGESEALTHDQAHGVTMRVSLRPGLAQGNAGAAVLCSAILRPPSCPAFPRSGFASHPSRGLMHQGRSGTMRALTPGALAHARQVSPLSRLAVRASHPQTRGAPRHPFGSHIKVPGGPCGPGFAIIAQARRYTPPKRVRHPTGCPFASGCSPPRLAATQLPSATCVVTFTWVGLAPP